MALPIIVHLREVHFRGAARIVWPSNFRGMHALEINDGGENARIGCIIAKEDATRLEQSPVVAHILIRRFLFVCPVNVDGLRLHTPVVEDVHRLQAR